MKKTLKMHRAEKKRGPELARLIREERALSKRLEKVRDKILDMDKKEMSEKEFDRLLDEFSEGLPDLPPLPANFSRADIYDDHD